MPLRQMALLNSQLMDYRPNGLRVSNDPKNDDWATNFIQDSNQKNDLSVFRYFVVKLAKILGKQSITQFSLGPFRLLAKYTCH